MKATFPRLPADGIMAGAIVRFCHDVSRTGRMGSMTDRRNERDDERERIEDERRREDEERDRRSDQLKESWRRNHPSEEEEGKGRPNRGRPA
ncbi:MAG: hypothetical protein H0U04_19880 [Rubrobacter sp.]|nr:hypothetical protein [Rubrobacter sp.]